MTNVRTFRMHDDAWALISDKAKSDRTDRSAFVNDMAEAGLGFARCHRCFTLVPVEFGDLTGKPLAGWVDEAREIVRAQHRAGHHPVTIGNEAAPQPAAKVAPAVVKFVEPKQAAR